MYPSLHKSVYIVNNIPVVSVLLHCCGEMEGWYPLKLV